MNRKSRLSFFITKNATFNIVPFVDLHHLQHLQHYKNGKKKTDRQICRSVCLNTEILVNVKKMFVS